jgi:hypothetical protein
MQRNENQTLKKIYVYELAERIGLIFSFKFFESILVKKNVKPLRGKQNNSNLKFYSTPGIIIWLLFG